VQMRVCVCVCVHARAYYKYVKVCVFVIACNLLKVKVGALWSTVFYEQEQPLQGLIKSVHCTSIQHCLNLPALRP